jgi:hypothetical protein
MIIAIVIGKVHLTMIIAIVIGKVHLAMIIAIVTGIMHVVGEMFLAKDFVGIDGT